MSKGLEALKEIQDLIIHLYDDCEILTDFNEHFDIIEKELKALEIIKPLVELTKEQNYCWLWLGLNGVQITQEEYDLLKEVLNGD